MISFSQVTTIPYIGEHRQTALEIERLLYRLLCAGRGSGGPVIIPVWGAA
jgi:hypothetical protein